MEEIFCPAKNKRKCSFCLAARVCDFQNQFIKYFRFGPHISLQVNERCMFVYMHGLSIDNDHHVREHQLV